MSEPNQDLPPLPPAFEDHLQALLEEREFVTEYQLMQHLVPLGFTEFQPSHDPLELFRAHFLLFHMLYRLQSKWFGESRGWLSIHTTDIHLNPETPGQLPGECDSNDLAEHDPIKAYYLDYGEFLKTQQEDVVRMLDYFWKRLGQDGALPNQEEWEQARSLFKLEESAFSAQNVKARFRLLSQQHHPDKGGDPEQFRQICEAKETLLARVKTG